jgi:hypothetical protein
MARHRTFELTPSMIAAGIEWDVMRVSMVMLKFPDSNGVSRFQVIPHPISLAPVVPITTELTWGSVSSGQ